MNIKDKLLWIFLPSLTLILIGILAIDFPNFFKHTVVHHVHHGGLLTLVSVLFLYIFWGKFMGILSILLGTIGVIWFITEIFNKEKIMPVNTTIRQQIFTLAPPKIFDVVKSDLKAHKFGNKN